jgi:hypothetical protein
MASQLYNKYAEDLLLRNLNVDFDTNDIRVALIDTGTYTFSAAHVDRADLTGVVALSGALASKTGVDGVCDAADITITGVTGASIEALVLYKHTGAAANDILLCYIDGFSAITPNGGDILIQWDGGANRIFAF